MLNPRSMPLKSYDELMEENLNKIPIYTNEWTNFNPADPGITTLENLSALQILQQTQIDEVTPSVRAKLLEMMGYTPRRGKNAEIYLEPRGIKESFDIPADQRFLVGDISFETSLPRHITASHMVGLYRETEKGIKNISYILEEDVTLQAKVFGKIPREGSALYFVMDKPLGEGEYGTIYVDISSHCIRNPFQRDRNLSFASIEWECYTEEGFVPLDVKDETHGFIQGGYIRFRQPSTKAAWYEKDEISGYVYRATLKENQYDVVPVMTYMSGFLFPVYQKETMIIAHSFQSPASVVLNSAMLENGYIKVYGKEQKGTSYMEYQESMGGEERGRFYRKKRLGMGRYAFEFDKEAFGYAPGRVKNAVKVVIYNEEMMRQYFLGEIGGYDNQEFNLPKEHIVSATFSVIAERELPNGEKIYDFLKPGRGGSREMTYSLYESSGRIKIANPGSYVGAKLYLGSLAVTLGPDGNVRQGNRFFPVNLENKQAIQFVNPAVGTGGCFKETLEEVRKRFVKDINTPETAATPADYESLIKRTPGLCIRKVRAWMDYARNEVQAVVLPDNEENYPKLSEKYRLEIESWMEDRRLLCTRLRVRQPVYTPVFTNGTIYVKPHYEGCRQQIQEVIRRNLDYINGNQQFGQTLRFDRLFHEIESLDCVSYIYELSVNPQNAAYAMVDGTDIVPVENCLLYPGSMKLDILPLPNREK